MLSDSLTLVGSSRIWTPEATRKYNVQDPDTTPAGSKGIVEKNSLEINEWKKKRIRIIKLECLRSSKPSRSRRPLAGLVASIANQSCKTWGRVVPTDFVGTCCSSPMSVRFKQHQTKVALAKSDQGAMQLTQPAGQRAVISPYMLAVQFHLNLPSAIKFV